MKNQCICTIDQYGYALNVRCPEHGKPESEDDYCICTIDQYGYAIHPNCPIHNDNI